MIFALLSDVIFLISDVNTLYILQIDFPSLVDVRILKRVDSSQSEATGAPASDGTSVPPNMSKKNNITEDGSKNVVPDTGNQELRTPGAPGMFENTS